MDQHTSKESGRLVDLEHGGTSSQEDASHSSVLGKKGAKKSFNRLASGTLGFCGTIGREGNVHSDSNLGNSSEFLHNNMELLMEKNSGAQQREEHKPLVEKKYVKEKGKTTNPKKASKPPRPPKGPSLDATDMKFVKEISELAMKKRARIERIKHLKRTRAANSSSWSLSSSSLSLPSNITFFAMAATLIFFLVLIIHGICSRNSSSERFEGSPEPAVATNSLIAVQFYGALLERDGISPSSKSPIAGLRNMIQVRKPYVSKNGGGFS